MYSQSRSSSYRFCCQGVDKSEGFLLKLMYSDKIQCNDINVIKNLDRKIAQEIVFIFFVYCIYNSDDAYCCVKGLAVS